ncbi:MAG: CBS domain-containing protein [Candidatus Marinimicrobia bacterium]|jgi:CBS domain-containing protein|nr:CBS domain-containing protein [Candidatus Neomarinimicrobiota bacterium]|tara:strand:- start:49 stop:471 length:423 start_codon:yes stop_codon:yes gene_type:complete
MKKIMNASNIMTTQLITFFPEDQVLSTIESLILNHISGAPVIGNDGQLLGIISEIDCMRMFVQSAYLNELGGVVGDVMSTDITTINSSMGIMAIAELFLETHYRRFPVVDNGNLVGQVSRRDVLKAVQKYDKGYSLNYVD